MIVYVESNFVLEVALLQEQHPACEELIRLAEDGRIHLVLPAFAVLEPYTTLFRRRGERRQIQRSLDGPLRELARTATLTGRVQEVRPRLDELLIRSWDDEMERWEATRARLAAVAEVAPLDESALDAAVEAETRIGLPPPDAVVYGSVRRHLERLRPARSCFLNRNTADFQKEVLVRDLDALGCRVLPRFDQGLSYVRGML